MSLIPELRSVHPEIFGDLVFTSIALGLLVATGQLLPDQVQDFATVGELALDGNLRPIKGALSIAMAEGVASDLARLLMVPGMKMACALWPTPLSPKR